MVHCVEKNSYHCVESIIVLFFSFFADRHTHTRTLTGFHSIAGAQIIVIMIIIVSAERL